MWSSNPTTPTSSGDTSHEQGSEVDKKRQRLAAWRNRQLAAASPATTAPVVSLTLPKRTLPSNVHLRRKIARKKTTRAVFSDDDDVVDESASSNKASSKDVSGADISTRKRTLASLEEDSNAIASSSEAVSTAIASGSTTDSTLTGPLKKRRRWDTALPPNDAPEISVHQDADNTEDALDRFMDQLQATAVGTPIPLTNPIGSESKIATVGQSNSSTSTSNNLIDSSGSFMRQQRLMSTLKNEDAALTQSKAVASTTFYQPADWLSESDAGPTDTEEDDHEDDEAEDARRRALIQALQQHQETIGGESSALVAVTGSDNQPGDDAAASSAVSAKALREERLRAIQAAAAAAQAAQKATVSDFGRDFYVEDEDGVMEEATRLLEAAQAETSNSTTALYLLAEQLNKKKELGAVNHDQVDYRPLVKNLYRVPPALAALSHDEVINRRAKLKVRVRGTGAPAPVTNFAQTGMPGSILSLLQSQGIETPFPIQAQCIPCILAGRDVIGIAKTGSGKTLAYALPLLRHIAVQPPLERHESGPMALILAPARELAVQIHSVCKQYAKPLGLK
jgi:DEAD/DEAH box helicase